MSKLISLPILIILPLIGSLLILTPFFKNHIYIRRSASIFAGIELFYSILFFIFYKQIPANTQDFNAAFNPVLIQSIPMSNIFNVNELGINILFGADNLSVLMILLTTFTIFISIYISKSFIKSNHKYYYSLILFLESILLGIFTTLDMFIFFILWELELIPMYFLISLWGNKKSYKSALKFILYTFGGSLFILLGILLIYYSNAILQGSLSAYIPSINLNSVNILLQLFISILLLIGFGVKIPLIPLHLWLADTHTNSTTPISIILAAVLLKLGVYGLIRFNMGILPLAFTIISPLIALLALINIIYGSGIAYAQRNLKKLIACSSISQMGIITLGLCTLNKSGYVGSVYHLISHSLISTGLFLCAGIIKNRFRILNLKHLSGIANVAPKLYGFSYLISLGAIGVPFLAGFVGEFLVIYGSVTSAIPIIKLFGVIAVSTLLLSALYILKFIHEVFFGKLPQKFNHVQDITVHEFIVLATLSTIIFIMGCLPNILIKIINL